MFRACVLLMLLGSGFAFFEDQMLYEKWDNLRVKWGSNASSPEFFNPMPRTVRAAKKEGFKLASKCDKKADWRGARYIKDDDPSIALLYDRMGYIVGIQTAVPVNHSTTGYPANLIPPFVKYGDNYVLTVYFVDPATIDICKEGRSGKQFKTQGTGTGLYIQNGRVAETDSMAIPLKEDGMGSTKWTMGKCYPKMGQHYWYNLSDDMDCQDFFPVFLLYNYGQLVGFGWIFMDNLSSPHFEHPTSNVYPFFLKSIPKCLSTAGQLTTLHIYMKDSVTWDPICG